MKLLNKGVKKGSGGKNLKGTLFWEFFKIGLFTVGGGMAMIPQIRQIVVEEKKWLTEEEMIDCFAVSQTVPGVIAVNAATYVGYRLEGWRGAFVSTLGVVMPSFIVITVIMAALKNFDIYGKLSGFFIGIKAAVIGLILVTAVKLGRQLLRNVFQWTVAVCAFVAVAVFDIMAVWVISAGAVSGIFINMYRIRKGEKGL